MTTDDLDREAIAEAAKTMTCNQIAANCGIPPSTMYGYLKRNNIAPVTVKREYARHAELAELSKDMTKRQLSAHYKVAFSTIETALVRYGLQAKREENYIERESYSNIGELCQSMTVNDLMAHYERSEGAIRKALSQRGLSAVYQRFPAHLRKPKPKKAVQKKNYTDNWNRQPTVTGRVSGTADYAADFLRKECPIFRCKDDGKADFAGKMFRRGSRVMTEAELIGLAKRKGWQEFGSMAA